MSAVILPRSILDTDLYKLTMQYAVMKHFPNTQSTYRFTHRSKDVPFSRTCADEFARSVAHFDRLVLTQEERDWLRKTCPYFSEEYLEYLSNYRFDPSQVHIKFIVERTEGDEEYGNIDIEAVGPWIEAIFWEVPLMSTLSEIYFTTVDTDWNLDGQRELAYDKAKRLLEAGCVFSEFGTRRRRSFDVQNLVVEEILRAERDLPNAKGKASGTSNVYLAMKHNTSPMGTIAHEWFMGVGAMKGYEHANALAMELWESVYPNALLLALTDTFSTKAFFQDFKGNVDRARHWKGLRQDSGDPFAFAPAAKEVYTSMGIDVSEKTIIYSDALDLEKALKLKKQCDEVGFMPSFGIGTFLTNDFAKASTGGKEKSKALNMVIKLASIEGKPCVKISDDLMKNTGDKETVLMVKDIFGLPK
ncbi:nicotinate phosphoribosyltransferase [Stereum hirsutum FP-91666 SS1]|uniref:nicotinate phosphoribosyltransferase n=1 Tax=Stereum hirsutum (strain FP-91666) TaxID=721885 RepID=UPI000440C2D2|nr:nicotinate phosphoribosyltransferase [Stereum hirsutum FP-91666 SS1]EIM91066.1 nicotinate phosphoribosyltransferase [Stereum hirsutum FP-91666 SS1]